MAVITGLVALTPYHWEMFLRNFCIFIHETAVRVAEEEQKRAAPVLTGRLRSSIRAEAHLPILPPRAPFHVGAFLTDIVSTKPGAPFSWVETEPRIYPVQSPVLVFPILPGWRPKRVKPLSEKEIEEEKIITAWVRGRKYNNWRERGTEAAYRRLAAMFPRLTLRPILGF